MSLRLQANEARAIEPFATDGGLRFVFSLAVLPRSLIKKVGKIREKEIEGGGVENTECDFK